MAVATIEQLQSRVVELEERVGRLEKGFPPKGYRIGVSLDEIREELSQPVERTPEEIEEAKKIVGIWHSGVEDLSENLHEYLYGKRP